MKEYHGLVAHREPGGWWWLGPHAKRAERQFTSAGKRLEADQLLRLGCEYVCVWFSSASVYFLLKKNLK